MFIVYNTATCQIVGYNPEYVECTGHLMCLRVPFIAAPLRFFNFEINGSKIEQTFHPTSVEDILVAEDCLDVNGGEFPYYCSVYASDENMARRRVIEMLKETSDE